MAIANVTYPNNVTPATALITSAQESANFLCTPELLFNGGRMNFYREAVKISDHVGTKKHRSLKYLGFNVGERRSLPS